MTVEYLEQPEAADIWPNHDPHYILGPPEWRIEHIKELEKAYAESRHLRHVRVLDWLPIMHAQYVPKFDVRVLIVMQGLAPEADT